MNSTGLEDWSDSTLTFFVGVRAGQNFIGGAKHSREAHDVLSFLSVILKLSILVGSGVVSPVHPSWNSPWAFHLMVRSFHGFRLPVSTIASAVAIWWFSDSVIPQHLLAGNFLWIRTLYFTSYLTAPPAIWNSLYRKGKKNA